MTTVNIKKNEMHQTLLAIFSKYGFDNNKAAMLATVFTENSLDGIISHGINRVSLFIEFVEKKLIDIRAEAEKIEQFGENIQRWDGHNGAGIINAITCSNQAVSLAKAHGIGIVALKNTNHWMRGGFYAWQAAQADCISIMFTNTKPNMPAWGSKTLTLGNNPFVVSIPKQGGHVVLDMALSQYSFGKMEQYQLAGNKLPFDGGWNQSGQLTKDPNEILQTQQSLPMGLWKGSALSMVLDMLATVLSGGNSTYRLGQKQDETGVSQVFLCIHKQSLGNSDMHEQLLKEIISFTQQEAQTDNESRTYYPGERTLLKRQQHTLEGIPVDANVWQEVLALLK